MDLKRETPSKLKTERLDACRPEDITRAAAILRAGGTVAFPTETVYGLGANALDPNAVAKIFKAKQRPSWDPLIVHIANQTMVDKVAITRRDGSAAKLMEAFWPGPLTLLLPRTSAVPDAVTAGRPLVGVRMPSHPVALELLRQSGIPIAAPSANTFGHTSPTTTNHVLADLDGRIDVVLDGGPTSVGLESTVAEVTSDGVIIYRPGAVTPEMIDELLGKGSSRLYLPLDQSKPIESLPSPGVGIRHYAPHARLRLIDGPDGCAANWDLLVENLREVDDKIGLMLPDNWPAPEHASVFRWGPWSDKPMLAQRLFAGLRALDEEHVTVIFCPLPSEEGMGAAIRDRLQKAAKA